MRPNELQWRNVCIVHRFSPGPGVRSSFLSVPDGENAYLQLGWSQLLRTRTVDVAGDGSNMQECSSLGKLSDGRSYAVVRVLLYTDDFKPYSFKQGSCGGCYLLPLSIPSWHRYGTESIRVLSLTPPGVSTNEAISAITDDIVRCSSEGVQVAMMDASQVTLFLDVVGYIGDYPAMAHLLDVTGVTGKAPCNFCTFERASTGDLEEDDGSRIEGSRYAYSSALHSGNLSFRRTRRRMELARQTVTVDDLQRLGLKAMSDEMREALPLHHLSRRLDDVRNCVPVTTDEKPVVPCVFDPYLSCYTAPDHLFFGIGEDIVKAVLRLLSPAQRNHVNALSVQALAVTGHTVEGSFLSSTTTRVHQMSFSSFFTFLLVCPWAVRIATGMNNSRRLLSERSFDALPDAAVALHALFSYQELFNTTMFVPVENVDGKQVVDDMEGELWEKYLSRVQNMATSYVNNIDRLCKRNMQVRSEVDKPNIHRLLEFAFHSLPRLGHASLFRELVLEGGHQPLKRGISRSNNHTPHQHSLARFLGDDWQRRLGDVACRIKDVGNLTTADCRMLLSVAFGRSDAIDEGAVTIDEVQLCFAPHVLQAFKSMATNTNRFEERRWVWVGRGQLSFVGCDREVIGYLRVLLTNYTNRDEFVRFRHAVLVTTMTREDDYDPIESAKRYSESNSLQSGNFIQLPLASATQHCSSSGNIILLRPTATGTRTFWRVISLFGVKKKDTVMRTSRK